MEQTFEALAREWYAGRSAEWSAGYSEKVIARLEGDVSPFIGRQPVGELTAPELLGAVRRIEARGVVETAHRVHESCPQIFRYAVGKGGVAERHFGQERPGT